MPTPIADFTHSPHAHLHAVPLEAVTLTDTFWEPRCAINRTVTLRSQLEHCENTGRIDNFRRASGKKQIEYQGLVFNDSDVYKVMEAIAFSLATHPDPELDAALDAVITEIGDAQCENGYLNTYFMFEREKDRWTNLRDDHEMYCAGHLFQAAVAHFRATGKRTLLDIAVKLADHIHDVFGEGKREGACGHPEIEMALIELSRTTGDAKYTELALRMINLRGKKPSVMNSPAGDRGRYWQDHVPYRELYEVTGHAVRMLYLASGATDAVIEADDPSMVVAIYHQWELFTERRMYVTGGAGSRYEGEAFGKDYELPNERAYTETCAAIASVMWNWRMTHRAADGAAVDLMEHTLYNAVMPGLSLDGKHYFYENPLADDGTHRRQEWFGCACCPPNVARTLSMLPGYFYSTEQNSVYVHLYANGTAAIPLQNGGILHLEQTTNYPWDGEIEIKIGADSGNAEALWLRIPQWASGAKIYRNGVEIEDNSRDFYQTNDPDLPNGYATVPRPKPGDVIRLSLPMPIEKLSSHPYVTSNRGQIALKRGPLIYCLEFLDHSVDVRDIVLPEDAEFTPEHRPELLGGITVLRGTGRVLDKNLGGIGANYLYVTRTETLKIQTVPLTAIPYYAWANRAPGTMRVWLPVEGKG